MMDVSIVTQSTRSPLKKKVHQILKDDHQPQYFSDAMSVLNRQPGGGGGGGGKAYYVVYNRTTSDCSRDDNDDMSAVTLATSRRDDPPTTSYQPNVRHVSPPKRTVSFRREVATPNVDDLSTTSMPPKSRSKLDMLYYDRQTSSSSATGDVGGDGVGNSSPRSLYRSSPVLSMLDEDDVLLAYSYSSMIDEEDDINVQGFASQAAETCVACTLPVIHFIQFFMC
jgi:hypothetical protein